MPTPFYHLDLARDLLSHPDLPPVVRESLEGSRSEFLFGNTAPDVQVFSGQPRAATHFFDLPLRPGDRPAPERMLARYPRLARPDGLPAAQAAFLAGYLCHLLADWYWVADIFEPVFAGGLPWKTYRERLYLHNVLRSYLDGCILPGLADGIGSRLRSASPERWLPFVQDAHLRRWRDFLAEQLYPGAAVHTVEVFASRQGISPEMYYELLSSEERLNAELFVHIPRRNLEAHRRRVMDASLDLLVRFLDR